MISNNATYIFEYASTHRMYGDVYILSSQSMLIQIQLVLVHMPMCQVQDRTIVKFPCLKIFLFDFTISTLVADLNYSFITPSKWPYKNWNGLFKNYYLYAITID